MTLYEKIQAIKAELPRAITPDSQGQFGKHESLEAVLDLIEPLAQKHRILILQTVMINGDLAYLETSAHDIEGGSQQCLGRIPLTSDKPGMFGIGAAITYFRRFALKTIFGMATGDEPEALHKHSYTNRSMYGSHPTPMAASSPKPQQHASGNALTRKPIGLFKKYAGQTYGQVPLEELLKSRDWLIKKAKEDGKPMGDRAEEFCLDVEALQIEAQQQVPQFAKSDEEIPF